MGNPRYGCSAGSMPLLTKRRTPIGLAPIRVVHRTHDTRHKLWGLTEGCAFERDYLSVHP